MNASACGNDNIIFINGCTNCYVSGCTSTNPYQRAGAPVVTCIEIADDCDNITIDGFSGTGSAGPGISIHCHNGKELPDNITVSNSSFYSNTGSGVQVGIAEAGGLCSARKSILFDNCLIYTNTLYGARLFSADTTAPNGVTFSECRIYSNTSNAIQHSIGANITFSQCEVTGRGSVFTGNTNIRLVNCTIYNAADAVPALNITGASGFYARNNIIMNNVAGQVIILVAAGTGVADFDFDYNLYRRTGGLVTNTHWYYLGTGYNWADWITAIGGDGHSPTPADPAFTNAGTGDFTLQAGSPAIDAGVDVGLPYLGTAPDCGYAEKA